MLRSPGERIGEGKFSDVHAWVPGQVVKLFKPGVPQQLTQHEARMTRAVFAAGTPAAEVLDEMTLVDVARVPPLHMRPRPED
ncbi:hypothetical protein [Sabulicella rubraurantiaca]|uniref:hypothetical protein n=1 Tax=Sabulicella rubraurantiaca TaxID=2811429 RepID=UPI001A968C14|nr:hypothetical protein [Sabulicella rubraurantiaca]